jgi:hypothetical protein
MSRCATSPGYFGTWLAAIACLAGCAGQPSQSDDAALTELQAKLPGRYDNAAQARSGARAGPTEAAQPIDLLIVAANAALIGKSTYYVRETPSGDPHRVLSQFIWVFGRTVEHGKVERDTQGRPKQYLEQHLYAFKEPQRWLRAGEQPEMLQSLLPDDLQRLSGCDLLWTFADGGFSAERHSASCSPEAKHEGQLIEQKIELKDAHLSLLEQQVSLDGLLDAPACPADSWYRFVRHGAAN